MYLHFSTCLLFCLAYRWERIYSFLEKEIRFTVTIGKVYMVLMMVTTTITLLMPALVGPPFLGHFG
jgi:hypothetical protein